MTVLDAIQRSTDFLARKGVESPRLQTELLLAGVLGLPRMQLYLKFERVLTEPETNQLREWVKRRGQHEPLQHILGSVCFCGLELAVSRDALIPRPETELLAERGWGFLNETRDRHGRPPAALDLCTGSGCLALALAAKCQQAVVWATDVSPGALELARANASRLNLAERVTFLQGDKLAALPPGTGPFDLIASNPPYIPSGEIGALQPEVRDFEPRLALDGGADGLDFYRAIAREAVAFLAPAGKLMLEIGDGQGEALQSLFAAQNWIVENLIEDYTARPRILVARRP